jgi:hypothetical protein
MRVRAAMLDLGAPASVKAIAARAGVTLDQARYALRPRGLLRSTGLVTHHAHGLWAIDPVAADAHYLQEHVVPFAKPRKVMGRDASGRRVVQYVTVAGAGQRRRERFDRERALFAEAVLVRSIERALAPSASQRPATAPAQPAIAPARPSTPAAARNAKRPAPAPVISPLFRAALDLGATNIVPIQKAGGP